MRYAFDSSAAPSQRTTQYFEILGNRGIYHEGWMASCFHGRLPWIRFAGFEFDGPEEHWELYNIADDFSQSHDLADAEAERLASMKALFEAEAEKRGVYPLRDASARRGGDYAVPHSLDGQSKITYNKHHTRMPEHAVLNLKNVSYSIEAVIEIKEDAAKGVIACQGGNMAGWSLYLDEESRPVYLYNYFGRALTYVRGEVSIASGRHRLTVVYEHDGGFGAGGLAHLLVNDEEVSRERINATVPVIFSMSGETFDIGRDTGAPVGPYEHQFPFQATSSPSPLNGSISRIMRQQN